MDSAQEQKMGEMMTNQPEKPKLSPQFCFATGTLRAFLRLSRTSLDDSIAQQLNALETPARRGFDPRSTAQLGPRAHSSVVDQHACAAFKDKILFPTWQTRTDVLNYCAVVAASPDPDDPGMVARAAEKLRDSERVVDERLDPYSGRFFPMEPRTQHLASILGTEETVEQVVRARTWSVLESRCGEPAMAWQTSFLDWQRKERRKERTSIAISTRERTGVQQ